MSYVIYCVAMIEFQLNVLNNWQKLNVGIKKKKKEMYLTSDIFPSLFFIICWLVSNVFCYKPASRSLQSSVRIGTKIYYFGGIRDGTVTDEAFYLDVDTLRYIPVENVPINTTYSSSVVNPKNDDICFFMSGFYLEGNESFYQFDSRTSKWSVANISGQPMPYSWHTKGVSDDKEKIYFFDSTYEHLNVLDVVTTSWITISGGNKLLDDRYYYTATLLQNGLIIFVGGCDSYFRVYSMNKVIIILYKKH